MQRLQLSDADLRYAARAYAPAESDSLLAALQDAGLRVIRIEPRINETGLYRVTLIDSPELAVRILKAIGGRASPSVSTALG